MRQVDGGAGRLSITRTERRDKTPPEFGHTNSSNSGGSDVVNSAVPNVSMNVTPAQGDGRLARLRPNQSMRENAIIAVAGPK